MLLIVITGDMEDSLPSTVTACILLSDLRKEDSQTTAYLSQNLTVPKLVQQHISFNFVKKPY